MSAGPESAADRGLADTWAQIHSLLCGYLAAVDGGDFDHVAAVLAGATVITPGGTLAGREEIRSTYERLQPVPHDDGRRRTKHHLTNLTVSEPAADGEVTAEAYYFVLEAGPDGPRLLKSGRFRERLRRLDDGWIIHEHQVLADF